MVTDQVSFADVNTSAINNNIMNDKVSWLANYQIAKCSLSNLLEVLLLIYS